MGAYLSSVSKPHNDTTTHLNPSKVLLARHGEEDAPDNPFYRSLDHDHNHDHEHNEETHIHAHEDTTVSAKDDEPLTSKEGCHFHGGVEYVRWILYCRAMAVDD